jgi:predicted SAM-dependent methyltransferase
VSRLHLSLVPPPLDDLRNEQGQIWLNVASSYLTLPEFVNLDNSPFLWAVPLWLRDERLVPRRYRQRVEKYVSASRDAIVVRHDCRKPIPFASETVDHILASHFLEHVYPDEADGILGDFMRLLRPGGTLHVIVPDLRKHIDEYLDSRGKAGGADAFMEETLLGRPNRGSRLFRMLELSGGFGLTHRWMYDEASMKERVENAGFSLIENANHPSATYRENDGSVHVCAKKPQETRA